MESRTYYYLKHRNSLVDIKLNEKIISYEREYVLALEHWNSYRMDLIQFLKQVHKCDSDKDPMAIRYLSDSQSRGDATGTESDVDSMATLDVERVETTAKTTKIGLPRIESPTEYSRIQNSKRPHTQLILRPTKPSKPRAKTTANINTKMKLNETIPPKRSNATLISSQATMRPIHAALKASKGQTTPDGRHTTGGDTFTSSRLTITSTGFFKRKHHYHSSEKAPVTTLKRDRIESRINRFCADIDEFKAIHNTRPFVHQVPSIF